jgi:hypothetical protein
MLGLWSGRNGALASLQNHEARWLQFALGYPFSEVWSGIELIDPDDVCLYWEMHIYFKTC